MTVWFDVTAEAVRTPPALIVAKLEFSLQVGLIAAVVPLSHVPVAVYVPVKPSFTDDGPLLIAMLEPTGTLVELEAGGDFTSRLAMQEEQNILSDAKKHIAEAQQTVECFAEAHRIRARSVPQRIGYRWCRRRGWSRPRAS